LVTVRFHADCHLSSTGLRDPGLATLFPRPGRLRLVLTNRIRCVPFRHDPRNRMGVGVSRFRYRGLRTLWLAAGLLVAIPAGASAQYPQITVPGSSDGELADSRWVGHFTVFSANALMSGVTAGTIRKIRGGSFSEGFTVGLVGGGAVYAGKAVAVQKWAGAGLVGREIAAVGSSVIRNAGEGRGALEMLALPLGPVRLHVRPSSPGSIRASLDLHNIFWTTYGILEPALHFDASASLSAGAPVFRTKDQTLVWGDGGSRAMGMALAGTIFLADVPQQSADDFARLFAHERVHVLQNDQLFYTMGDPVESWLLRQLPGGNDLSRVFDPNILLWAVAYPGGRMLHHRERPWEMEAEFLAKR
jgi:hypothetical protein